MDNIIKIENFLNSELTLEYVDDSDLPLYSYSKLNSDCPVTTEPLYVTFIPNNISSSLYFKKKDNIMGCKIYTGSCYKVHTMAMIEEELKELGIRDCFYRQKKNYILTDKLLSNDRPLYMNSSDNITGKESMNWLKNNNRTIKYLLPNEIFLDEHIESKCLSYPIKLDNL